MLRKLRQQWKAMNAARPGRRFQIRYHQRRHMRASALWTPLYVMVGSLLFVLGLTMLVAPGPGLIVLFVGAALIAQESLVVARALDRSEIGGRRAARTASRLWKRAPAVGKAGIIAVSAFALAGAGWGAYTVFIA